MKAVIPAAGVGSRMRPYTYTTPKILMKLGKKAIIDHIIEGLISNGIDEINVILSPEGEEVESHIQNNFSVKSRFVFQYEPEGIAHAISMVTDSFSEEPVLIILGDTLFEGDLKKVLSSKYSCLGVKEVEDPRKFGVAVTDKKGFIKRLVEKPDDFVSNLALVGIYYIKHGIKLRDSIEFLFKNDIRTKNEYQITDAIQDMIMKGEKITTYTIDGWYDCGNHENFLKSNRYILEKFPEKPEVPGSTVIYPCYISPKAEIIE